MKHGFAAHVSPSPTCPAGTRCRNASAREALRLRSTAPGAPGFASARRRSLRSRRRRRPRIPRTRAARRPAGPVVRTRRERVTPAVVRRRMRSPERTRSRRALVSAGTRRAATDRRPAARAAGLLSQPPFAVAHSSMSTHVSPSPSYPEGHAPHVRPPTTLEHVTSAEQPPLTSDLSGARPRQRILCLSSSRRLRTRRGRSRKSRRLYRHPCSSLGRGNRRCPRCNPEIAGADVGGGGAGGGGGGGGGGYSSEYTVVTVCKPAEQFVTQSSMM